LTKRNAGTLVTPSPPGSNYCMNWAKYARKLCNSGKFRTQSTMTERGAEQIQTDRDLRNTATKYQSAVLLIFSRVKLATPTHENRNETDGRGVPSCGSAVARFLRYPYRHILLVAAVSTFRLSLLRSAWWRAFIFPCTASRSLLTAVLAGVALQCNPGRSSCHSARLRLT
jgi:hypothetical protein